MKYSALKIFFEGLSGNRGWKKAWREPEPKKEYTEDNQRQINRALSTVIEQLNSTYLTQLKEDSERYTFFGLG